MRHKYHTPALVLARSSLGEANTLLTLLTPELGLVRARAQGLRKSGAKLAGSLPTFAESELILVRGAEGWRLAGATLATNWFREIPKAARTRAARVTGLLLRLVPGETADAELFHAMREFFSVLTREPEPMHDAAECLAALRLLSVLGLDAGEVPTLRRVIDERPTFIARINRGITASGL